MKKTILIILNLLLIGPLVFGISRNRPEDGVILWEGVSDTGTQFYTIDVNDPNGGYPGNYLRVRITGDVDGLGVADCSVWPQDANYILVPTTADPNTNCLTGTFRMGKNNWQPGHYEIAITVYDVADHNDTKWVILDVLDKTPPIVGGCRR